MKPNDEDAPRDEATEVIERPVITPPDTYVSLTAAAPRATCAVASSAS